MPLRCTFAGPYRSNSAVLMLSLVVATTQFPNFLFSQSNNFPQIKISKFGQVNENYYRGGQPYALDCVQLKKLGIKTVIDLQKDGNFQEPSWVQNAGMQYIKIPLSSSHPATAEQTAYFLKVVNDPASWPVYVHCYGGRHRTGEMSAIYRITHDSWDADRAYQEMKKYGYYTFPNHGSLRDYVYSYYKDYQSSARKEKDNTAPAPTSQQTVGAPAGVN
jgi:protein tyrosine/serine phosphatase